MLLLFRLPSGLYEVLRNEAFEERVSMAKLIRQALEERYQKEEKPEG